MVNLAVKIGVMSYIYVVLDQKWVFRGYEQWIFLFLERENGPFFELKIWF